MNATAQIWRALIFLIAWACMNSFAVGGRVVAWGDSSHGQTNVPPGLTNVIAVAGGYWHSLAALADGTVVAWGDNSYGQTNVPVGLTNVTSVACGLFHSLALKKDGTVVAWGYNLFGQANVPPGLSNVVSIAAGDDISVALKNDHTVVGWGNNSASGLNVPEGLTNIVGIGVSAGEILLTSEGTVIYWGPSYKLSTLLGNAVAIANSGAVILRGDGTVADSPAGISNLVAVSGYTSTLRNDGTVVEWDLSGVITTKTPPGLSNVVAIGTGGAHILAIVEDELPLRFTSEPSLQTPYNGETFRLYASALGRAPLNYQWQFEGTNIPGATNVFLTLTNVQASNDGNYAVIVSNQTGVVISSNTLLKTIICPPVIISHSPGDQLALIGTNITLSVTATGPLPMAYQWQLRGTNIDSATSSSLAITDFQVSNEGQYTVLVSNSFLSVTSAPMVITAGDFSGAVNARNLTWESFQAPWYWQIPRSHDGVAVVRSGPVSNGGKSILTTTCDGPATLGFWMGIYSSVFDTLTFSIDGVDQAYIYDSDPYGNQVWQQDIFYLPIGSHTLEWTFRRNSTQARGSECGFLDEVKFIPGPTSPIITMTLTNQEIPATGSATFAVAATGTPPLLYQWQFNGIDIIGATNTALTLTSLQSSNAGPYTVLVANPYGTNNSSAALIVIPVAPIITTQPSNQRVPPGGNATLTVAAKGSLPISYQWQFNGSDIAGATTSSLSLLGVHFTNAGDYQVRLANDAGTTNSVVAVLTVAKMIAWGYNYWGQTTIPLVLTNALAVSAGAYHSLALNFEGTVAAWGQNFYHQCDVPIGLGSVVDITSGFYHNVALRSNGTIVAWGAGTNVTSFPNSGQSMVPPGLNGVSGFAAGGYHTLVLRSNGTVTAWGYNLQRQTNVPANLSNVVAVAAGGFHSLALRGDGTAVGWGAGTNTGPSPNYGQSKVPPDLSNIVAIAAGQYHSMALREDGTVVAWGDNNYGQTAPPPGLTSVVAIACGGNHSFALKSDGNLVLWGNNAFGQSDIPVGLTNVIAAKAGDSHNIVLMNDGSPVIVRQVSSRTIYASTQIHFSVGAVGIPVLHFQWQFNGTDIPGGTNATLVMSNPGVGDSGSYQCVVENSLGSSISLPAILTVLRPSLHFEASSAPDQLSSTGFSLKLSGLSGHGDIVLYGSTNCLNWEPVLTNGPTVGSLILLDPSATNFVHRLYRAVER